MASPPRSQLILLAVTRQDREPLSGRIKSLAEWFESFEEPERIPANSTSVPKDPSKLRSLVAGTLYRYWPPVGITAGPPPCTQTWLYRIPHARIAALVREAETSDGWNDLSWDERKSVLGYGLNQMLVQSRGL